MNHRIVRESMSLNHSALKGTSHGAKSITNKQAAPGSHVLGGGGQSRMNQSKQINTSNSNLGKPKKSYEDDIRAELPRGSNPQTKGKSNYTKLPALDHRPEKDSTLVNAGIGAVGLGAPRGLHHLPNAPGAQPAPSSIQGGGPERSLERNPSVLSRKELIQ